MREPLRSKRPGKGPIARSEAIQAPVGGWNTRDPQAAMSPKYALYLDNWWPTAKSVQIRQGALDHVTGFPKTVKTLLSWNGPASSKLFACTDDGIYDATTAGAVGATVSTLTNGRVESCNFSGTGGHFLICVNGVDQLRYYNGTSWANVATFTIGAGPATLATTDIVNIHSFKRGLFFLKKDSLSVFYLPIDQILGSVAEFPLGALFNKGGYLVAQGTWSVDGGKGLDDLTVFVTSEGQMAIYQGTDPGSSSTWALIGVFDLAKPLGRRCFVKYGGDLLYLSYLGCSGVSKSLQSTRLSLEPSITNTIAEAFTDAASLYGENLGWEFCISPNENILLVNVPLNQYIRSHQYVMNTNTGAWCRFTGWDAYCWVLYGNVLYMGMSDKVARAWEGGTDFGNAIACYAKQAYVYLPPRANLKQISQLQPLLKLGGRVAVDMAVDNDFEDADTYAPAVFGPGARSRFDTAQFDIAQWSTAAVVKPDWLTVADQMGYAKAFRLRVLGQDATVEWSATNVLYESGAQQG